ncbi:MAG: LysR family transcriptional regulator [Holophagaceae bacterium]|nr:LysR family transcriptional regulator [Holophagaceae bacterium]
MDLAQLEAFIHVAREKSFSRAAHKLFRTQPALSIAIKRLEEELGETLFDRSAKGGELTDAGRTLLSYAQRMLNLREEALEAVADYRRMLGGTLTIGANESTSLYLLPSLLLRYRDAFPQIRINVQRHLSERLPVEVLERNLDFGFLSFEPPQSALESLVVHKDELVLVVPPDHPFAGREEVALKELGKETFVAHNARTPARTQIIELFQKHRTPLNIAIELATLETIKDFVRLGAGLAILPRLSVRDAIEAGSLVEVPVKGLAIEKVLRMVYRKEENLSHAAKAFLALVREREIPKESRARRR